MEQRSRQIEPCSAQGRIGREGRFQELACRTILLELDQDLATTGKNRGIRRDRLGNSQDFQSLDSAFLGEQLSRKPDLDFRVTGVGGGAPPQISEIESALVGC